MNSQGPTSLLDPDAIQDGTTVLLEAPAFGPRADEGCVELLRLFPPPTNVLYVTLVQPPETRLEAWERHAGGEPSSVGFVVAGHVERPAGATSGRSLEGSAYVETVSTAGDLTGIGIGVHKILDRWASDDAATALCFHSLTPLLQHVDLRDAFQFLHLLTNQLRTRGAIAHFHVDPDAHDRQTLHTLYAVFDVVVGWEPEPATHSRDTDGEQRGDDGEQHGDDGEQHGDDGEQRGDDGEQHGDDGEQRGDDGEQHGDDGEQHGDDGEQRSGEGHWSVQRR